VYEQCRRPGDAGLEPGGEVGLHLVAERLGHLADDAVGVEAEHLGVATQGGVVEPVLLDEEQLVHRPERALRTGGLRGQRRGQRVAMAVGQREVAEHQADAAVGLLHEPAQHRRRGRAVRALVVAVLEHGHRRARVPEHVVVLGRLDARPEDGGPRPAHRLSATRSA
jgi:hypothetical protein